MPLSVQQSPIGRMRARSTPRRPQTSMQTAQSCNSIVLSRNGGGKSSFTLVMVECRRYIDQSPPNVMAVRNLQWHTSQHSRTHVPTAKSKRARLKCIYRRISLSTPLSTSCSSLIKQSFRTAVSSLTIQRNSSKTKQNRETESNKASLPSKHPTSTILRSLTQRQEPDGV